MGKQLRILGTPKDYLLKDLDNLQMAVAKCARSADMIGYMGTMRDLDCIWLDILRVQTALVGPEGRRGVVTLAAKYQEERNKTQG